MTILPQNPLSCELTAGLWLLRLLFIWLLLVSWAVYQQTYPQGWRRDSLTLRHTRPWRLKPRTPEACEACQKGMRVQIFCPRTEVVPYRETKVPVGGGKP